MRIPWVLAAFGGSLLLHGIAASALFWADEQETVFITSSADTPFEMVVLAPTHPESLVPSEAQGVETAETVEPITEPQPEPVVEEEPIPEPEPIVEPVPEPKIEPVAEMIPTSKPEPEKTPVEPTEPQLEPEPIQQEQPEGEAVPVSGAESFVEANHQAAELNNRKPAYPRKARKRGLEGTVLLRVAVSAAGTPQEIFVTKSSGHRLLDQAAKKTVWKWKFHPAQQGGEAVASTVEVPIQFSLKQ